MEIVNLYGEDGIFIYLDEEYYPAKESEAVIKVIGHVQYPGMALEDVQKCIQREYMERKGYQWHPYHGWITEADNKTVEEMFYW